MSDPSVLTCFFFFMEFWMSWGKLSLKTALQRWKTPHTHTKLCYTYGYNSQLSFQKASSKYCLASWGRDVLYLLDCQHLSEWLASSSTCEAQPLCCNHWWGHGLWIRPPEFNPKSAPAWPWAGQGINQHLCARSKSLGACLMHVKCIKTS